MSYFNLVQVSMQIAPSYTRCYSSSAVLRWSSRADTRGHSLHTVTCLQSILLLWSNAKMRLRYNKNHHNNMGVSICHQLAGAHTYARQLSKLGSLVCGTYHLGIWGVTSWAMWNSQSESQPWNSTGRMLKSWDVKRTIVALQRGAMQILLKNNL